MRAKTSVLYFFVILLLGVNFKTAMAQYQLQHQSPTLVERGSTVGLTFSAPGITASDIYEATLFYRTDGDLTFARKTASFSAADFNVRVDIADNAAASFEYYLQVELTNGEVTTFPQNQSLNGPVQVEIVEPGAGESQSSGAIEYTILSPEQGQEVSYNDVVIAINLFYDDEAGSADNFRLYLDGEDITEEADASDYFLSYVPDNLAVGSHSISLEFEGDDGTRQVTSWNFTATAGEITEQGVSSSPQSVNTAIPSGQVELKARNQTVGNNSSDIFSGNVRLSGESGGFRYSAYGLLTSQEDSRFQAQNRYGVELYAGNWFELQGGHIYPTLSPLTINGQRVRGINAALHPFRGAVNLQFLYGRLRRSVSNLYTSIEPNSQNFGGGSSFDLNFESNGIGTFERDVIGGRLSFGRGNNFQFGINALKVEDDTTSINTIDNFNDAMSINPNLADGLSQADRDQLRDSPDLLNANGNPNPQGNVVAGADLMANFDNKRIRFRADGAISLLNEDISRGALTQQRAEELGLEIDEDLANTLDELSWLIILNENLSVLPFKFDDNGDLSTFEFPSSALGGQSEISFNYLKNNLRLQYQWVGPNFNSLANSTVRNDIAGLSVTDRFRLFQNQIYVTLGYDNLRDNVSGFEETTTNTNRYRGNLSWFPVNQDLPRISLGVSNRARENGVDVFNPFVPSRFEDAGIQNFQQENGATLVAPRPRDSNTLRLSSSITQQFDLFGITHDASLNYSWLNTTENNFAFGDAQSNNFSFRITNRFRDLPLNTNVGFNVNNTETSNGLADISIYGANIGGTVFLLDNTLNFTANMAYTHNETDITPLGVNNNGTLDNGFDDYYEPNAVQTTTSENNSYIFSAEGRYNVTVDHAFLISARLSNVSSSLGNNSIPNDRIVQARYIFTF